MNAIQITAQLYTARDTAKTLLGDRYPEKMREFGDAIQNVASARKIELIPAMTAMAKAAMDEGQHFAALFTMAACVELVEPSEVANA